MLKLEALWETVRLRRNVQGYSKKLRRRVRGDRVVEEEVFRVYVREKLPLSALAVADVIPSMIQGVATDVVVIGDISIPPLMAAPLAYTERVRPLEAGISIGNRAITAGTLGWFFEKDGDVAIGSNAHVLAENPLEAGSREKTILQPGAYDGGRAPRDVVAEYRWHQQLYGGVSTCPVGQLFAGLGNMAARLSARRTRFKLLTTGVNRIDFAVTGAPLVPYELKVCGAKDWSGFVGLGFAGSSQASFFCKAEHIMATGWKPIDVDVPVVDVGDTLHKVGRTTEYTTGAVIDDCAHGKVDYGGGNLIEFDDLILTTKMLEGGDSGDAVWDSMVLN